MKKIIFFIILLIIAPSAILANTLPGKIISYDAVISNPDGLEVYLADDWCKGWCSITDASFFEDSIKINLKYGDAITIQLEVGDDGYFCPKDYNGKCGFVDLKDIKTYSEKIDFKNFEKSEENIKLYAYDDVEMYAGPSIAYEKIQNVKIPKGATIEYEYYDEHWCYVTYNNVSGWIACNSHIDAYVDVNVANIDDKATKILFIDDVEFINKKPYGWSNKEKEKEKIDIQKGTILETNISYNHVIGTHKEYLIEYNGISGWITVFGDDARIIYGINISNMNGAKLYANLDINSKILTNIPYKEEVKIINVEHYKKENSYSYITMYKVEYNGLIGYVKAEDFDETINDKPIEPEEDDKEEPNVPIKPENPNDTEKEENNSMDSSWHIKNVILTVFFCVILALVTLVTILLINKKKKVEEIEIIGIEEDKEK